MEVNESASAKANSPNLDNLRVYMNGWKSRVDDLKIWPKPNLFDRIAFAHLNKVFRLGEACISLIERGFSEEAFGLSRSMIDCTLNLRYLTLERDEINARSESYLNFFYADRKHYLDVIRRYYPDDERYDAFEAIAKEDNLDERWKPKKGNPLPDWKAENWWEIITTNHPLDEDLNKDCPVRRLYSYFHRGSSAMVHCSVNSLANFLWDHLYSFRVGERRVIIRDHTVEPMLVIPDCLYLCLRYAFYGVNIVQTEPFDKLYADLETTKFFRRNSP